MKKSLLLSLLLLVAASALMGQRKSPFSPKDINIPYEKFTLENGLTLIVHEDHKAPIVAVNVWYHVGSKNEKPGKSGFAHLFEHLMFNGSENFNDDYFQALERIGGTDLNGTTNVDRTNYFQNVPTAALDQLLFLESDRMGHLLGAIDQAKLDEQRGVVQNEKRQGENQPYGKQWEILTKAMYPTGHPYSWSTIGEMEHLNAASLDDVHEWFKAYYGTANAVLVVAGDVKPSEIFEKVKNYFGDIPAGPTIERWETNVVPRTQNTRQSWQDRVPEARVTMAWNTPEQYTKEAAYLELASSILSSGKNSRLYKKLIYEDQSSSSAFAFTWDKEIAGNFYIQANVKNGVPVETVENTVSAILDQFLKEGPTAGELERVKAEYFSDFIKGLERIGGFGGKSDLLASSMVYGNSPDDYKTYLDYMYNATPQDIHNACKKWLAQGRHTLICTPFPTYGTTLSTIDRATVPMVSNPVPASFPDIQRGTLKNGMKVILAARKGVPTVEMEMMFDAGYASDFNSKLGTASLAMNMMDEGTKAKTALQINEDLQFLGAGLFSYSDLDNSYVSMSTLKPSLDASLDLYADVLLNPSFPAEDFDRLKQQQLAGIQREQSNPFQMALRVFPTVLYGDNHPYNMPFTGSGTEESINSITRDDMQAFYNAWVQPNNATLMVVGDLTMDELMAKLEKRFGTWKQGKVAAKPNVTAPATKGNTLYVMDRPEATQSIIISGYLVDPYGKVPEIDRQVMNDIFGGDFTSRINMNLREDKHWSYGSRNIFWGAKGQRPMFTYAPVQTDKTMESCQEIMKEFNMVNGDKPITMEEFQKVQTNTALKLPGKWETNEAVGNSIKEMAKYGLSDDYFKKYDQEVRSLTLDDVRSVAKSMLRPSDLTWMVVGDKAKVLSGLETLGFDKIIIVDPTGKQVGTVDSKSKP